MPDHVKTGFLVDFLGDVFAVGLEGGDDINGGIVLGYGAAGADGSSVDHDGRTVEAAHGHQTTGLL